MADWAELPLDILGVIAERSHSMEDFIFFGAVCKSWQSSTLILERKPPLPITYPWLMLAETMDTKRKQDVHIRCFLSLLTSKTYELRLPEAIGRKCFGAGYGWLMTIGTDLQINLLHPFSRQQICLPPMLTFPVQYDYNDKFPPRDFYYFFVRKIVMSSNPGKKKSSPNYNPDCIVAAIYGEVDILAFARLGDSVWTNITVPSRSYDDIVYYSGKFYAVDCHGVVVVCDLDDDNGPKAIVVAPAPTKTRDSIQKYLVESAGELLLVSRIRGGTLFEADDKKKAKSRYYTIGFSIFRLEECRGEGNKYAYSLVELNTLGDQALFLGNNVSTSLSSLECKGTFKANCIYFTDDNFELYSHEPGGGGNDAGIFDMEKGTIELNYGRDFRSYTSPSLWYL